MKLLARMENRQGSSINYETFTWKIENFSKQNTMDLQSKKFRIRGYKWRILLYPLRKDVNHFSLYLMVADSLLPPYGWSRNTYFKLALINQVDGNKSVVKETHQKFKGGHRSWGSSFLNLSDFYDSKQGYLVNNTCIIKAHVCVSDVALDTTIQADNLNEISSTNDSKSGDQETESSDKSETQSPTISGSSQTEEEVEDSYLTLRDLLDLERLKKEEEAYIPLLEEACIWRPSLIRSQKEKTRWFRLWAFISLGRVLHILKTSKVKDMNENACNILHGLWEELKSSGFDLAWLEPYVQSALAVKPDLERYVVVKELQDNVAAMEIKMNKLREELAAAEAEFEVERRALVEARKEGFREIDLNAELGYGMY